MRRSKQTKTQNNLGFHWTWKWISYMLSQFHTLWDTTTLTAESQEIKNSWFLYIILQFRKCVCINWLRVIPAFLWGKWQGFSCPILQIKKKKKKKENNTEIYVTSKRWSLPSSELRLLYSVILSLRSSSFQCIQFAFYSLTLPKRSS